MNTAGSLRKPTGSYYTPAELVDCLLDSALQPLIDGALQAEDPEKALLEITVCDPACGGGVFLVRAARRIAWYLAMYRAGLTGSVTGALPAARYEVATRLIHGVDISPLAVDTCRLMVAATAYIPGVPNPRLEHRIKCGNALLGATPALLAQGIPDAAFTPLPGDDPAVTAALRRRNRAERNAQPGDPMEAAPRTPAREAAPRTPARRRGSAPLAP